MEAIISINIPSGHDGSVITSGYQIHNNGFGSFSNGNWIFSTIKSPWGFFTQGLDGPHPVSGNRKFGLTKNSNGSYTMYTRGVDRFQSQSEALVAAAINNGNPFAGADNLWTSFQQGVKNYIQNNSYGNTVTINTPVKWRPNWTKVKNVLKGTTPITSLGCN